MEIIVHLATFTFCSTDLHSFSFEVLVVLGPYTQCFPLITVLYFSVFQNFFYILFCDCFFTEGV